MQNSPHKVLPKKKIIYISANGYLGGAEKFVLEACIGHKKYGNYDPHVLFFNDGEAIKIFEKFNINFTILKQKFKLSKPLTLLKACYEIRKTFIKNNWDLYNATMAYPQFVMGLALMDLPVKKIWFQHGPVGNFYDLLASIFPYEFVIYNSRHTMEEHHKTVLFNPPKLGEKIISYGIPDRTDDNNLSETIRNKFLGDANKILILMAGRICEWKGYETAFYSLDKVFKKNPSLKNNIHLTLVGSPKTKKDFPYEKKLRDITKELDLLKNISFIPAQENINDYYLASDIFLHTSKIPEPFGLVLAEAMKQGILVIGSSQGGTTEMLQDGVTGYSYDATNIKASEELYKLLLKVISCHEEDSKYLEKIKSQGKSLINQKFSVKRMIIELEALYESL